MPIKIAISESDKKLHEFLVEKLAIDNNFEVISQTYDGKSCLNDMTILKPDILLMDILLSDLDGLELLEKLREKKDFENLTIIVMTAFTSDPIIKSLVDYKVDYITKKPFNVNFLIKNMESIFRTKEEETNFIAEDCIIYDQIYCDISNLLIDLGIKQNLDGYNYLKTAIYKSYKQIDLLSSITKSLYPLIASIYDTTAIRVERSMRHAIECAWKDQEYIKKAILPYGYSIKSNKKPSNSRFIAMITDYLRILDASK